MSNRDLTQGSIGSGMAAYALPYLLAYMLQTTYSLADIMIVGQLCGVEELTAAGIGSQVMHFATVLIVGIGMGTTVGVGRAIGARDDKGAATAIGNTATLAAAYSLVLTAVLLAATEAIAEALNTPQEAMDATVGYLKTSFGGIAMIAAYNTTASIYRGLGDSQTPMKIVAGACLLNIALDLLLVGPGQMGAQGAAIATVLAQATSAAAAMWHLQKHDKDKYGISLSRHCLRPQNKEMRGLLKTGLPIALQDGFIQVAFIFITIIANKRGLSDAAAVGVSEKIIGILFLVPSTMLSTVTAMAAQNIGAGRPDRARKTLATSLAVCATTGLATAAAFQIVAEDAIALFSSNADVIAKGSEYLSSYIWDCLFAGLHFCYSGYFCASGWSSLSFAHNAASILLVRIPGSYWASLSYPDSLRPMGMAAPAGSILSLAICILAYHWLKTRQEARQTEEPCQRYSDSSSAPCLETGNNSKQQKTADSGQTAKGSHRQTDAQI